MRRALLLAAALVLAACGHEDEHLSGVPKVAPPGQRPSEPPVPAVPHGADPHAGMTAPPPVAAAPAPIAWTVPADWKVTPPSGGMRIAQFDVGVDGDGDPVRCIVFGGIGGSDEDNLGRWVGQMEGATKDSVVIGHSEHDGLKITRLEARGKYTDGMRAGPPKVIPEATMLGAIVESAGGKVHVKFVGAKSIVDPAAAKFDAFLASLKPK